ncbi:MAG: hypothetical protein ABH833_01970 [Parcubacteria group bacterium]
MNDIITLVVLAVLLGVLGNSIRAAIEVVRDVKKREGLVTEARAAVDALWLIAACLGVAGAVTGIVLVTLSGLPSF